MPAEFNRRGIFSSEASAEAENLVLRPELFKGRPSFPAFTIDNPNTQRRDDGIGHEVVDGQTELVYIHVTDFGSVVLKDSLLFQTALSQSSAEHSLHRPP